MTTKELQNELQKTFEQFKNENDALIEQVKKTGAENATTRQNVENLNKRIDELQDALSKCVERNDELEASVNRLALGGADTQANNDVAKHLEVFNALTGQSLDAKAYSEYTKALETYMRRGEKVGGIANALSVGSDPSGGYWVTPDRSGALQQKIYETSPMRQLCNVVTISTDALEGPIDNDEVSTGWTSETAPRSQTDTPQVGKYRIEVFEQYAKPRVTQQLLDDAAFPVEQWLLDKVADKFSRTENTAFLTGDGSGKPRGLLNYSIVSTDDSTRAWDAIQYVPSGKSGGFADDDPADALIDLVYKLKNAYRPGAAFLANRTTYAAIRKIKSDTTEQYLWQPGLQAGQPATLLGYPAIEAEDMPAIGAGSYSIIFGDFRAAYTIVDRQGVRLLRDPYTAKPYVVLYLTKRVGGGLVNGEAVKVMKFSAS